MFFINEGNNLDKKDDSFLEKLSFVDMYAPPSKFKVKNLLSFSFDTA